MREIIYRVLRVKTVKPFSTGLKGQKFYQIAKVLNNIHQTFIRTNDIKGLAMEAGMCISSFHTSFKAVTDASPCSILKSVRLHKAREFMIQDGINAL
jgi:AraC-like DNA-binding protein